MSEQYNKTHLEKLLEDSLIFEGVETAFFGLLLDSEEDIKRQYDIFVDGFKQFWNTLTPEIQEKEVVAHIVDYANQHNSTVSRITHFYELLNKIIEKDVIKAKKACEALLNSPHLKLTNTHVWSHSFKFIANYLPLMDYKSVRAVFSVLLNKVKYEFPERVSNSQMYLIDEAKKVINMGLDRAVCLLPSYFVVNEIYKLYPVDDFHPHWAFGKEFSAFTSSFKNLAQMVSIVNHSKLAPIVGHASPPNVWNLEPTTLKFPLKGPLPYKKEILESQKHLLQYVMMQPYSREYVCSMLGPKSQQKQRCEPLEEILVDLMIFAMERAEASGENEASLRLLWQHLSSQLIFFILYQFASFPKMIMLLNKKISNRAFTKGREQLIWILLQFISGSIQKSPLYAFTPIIKLFNLLYPEKTPLPVTSTINPDSLMSFSMACIWIHLTKKARADDTSQHAAIIGQTPPALTKQIEFLSETLQKPTKESEYEVALLCNAYSTNLELSQPLKQEVLSKICDNTTVSLPRGCLASGGVVPLEMKMLDALTVHTKMGLIHGIVSRINMVATQHHQNIPALSPALVETYSRLMVFMEIEPLGIKGFITQVLPNVVNRCKAWSVLHPLLEMFTYRLHRVQAHYRTNLISSLHRIPTIADIGKPQLHTCIENTALKLIMGFGYSEIQMQLSFQRYTAEPSLILSRNCEELNQVLILMIAKAIHITGADSLPYNWYELIVKEAANLTPHRFAPYTLACFPRQLRSFVAQNTPNEENHTKMLLSKVEKHYKKMKSFSNDQEILAHFNDVEAAEVFLCVMWKILLENNRITPICQKILLNISQSNHLRSLNNCSKVLADFLINEFKMYINSSNVNSSHVTKRFQFLNEVIWKYEVISFDRLLLAMILRPYDEKSGNICFNVIKCLLLEFNDFKIRAKTFFSENVAQHWSQSDWHKKHTAYHEQFPERHYFEGILEVNGIHVPSYEYLPTYFSNVCLRMLPVFELLVHKLIECNQFTNLRLILAEYAHLLKFIERPITLLYGLLHYYEEKLGDSIPTKRKLVAALANLQTNIKDKVSSPAMIDYLNDDSWKPNKQFFVDIIHRIVKATQFSKSKYTLPASDWRFTEFPNQPALVLHMACVELMALPIRGDEIGHLIIDVITNSDGYPFIRENNPAWINATALLFTSLPESFLHSVNTAVMGALQHHLLHTPTTTATHPPPFFHPHQHYDRPTYLMALFHATWLHATTGQFSVLPRFLQEQLKILISNETQLLYVFCLYGPFLQRFQLERPRCLFEVAKEFYHLTEQVCRTNTSLVFVDLITDFLYHIKYMFAGDHLRDTVERVMPNFHPDLQNKLKFMGLTKKEGEDQKQQQQPTMQQTPMQQSAMQQSAMQQSAMQQSAMQQPPLQQPPLQQQYSQQQMQQLLMQQQQLQMQKQQQQQISQVIL